MEKELQFLIYSTPENDISVNAVIKDDTIWLTQKSMADLFYVGVPAISKHFTNIYAEGELDNQSTVSKMEIVQTEGNRQVKRKLDFYNLDVTIAKNYLEEKEIRRLERAITGYFDYVEDLIEEEHIFTMDDFAQSINEFLEFRRFNKTISFVSPDQSKKLKKAKTGDVPIVGVSDDIEGVCKPLAWLGGDICISGDMFAFRHNQNTKYIIYLLQTLNFGKYKEKFAHGAKVTRLRQEKLLEYKIPLPPLQEQERIVSILDKFDALVNDISIGLPDEIEARQKQYEYYREKLLTFKELGVKGA